MCSSLTTEKERDQSERQKAKEQERRDREKEREKQATMPDSAFQFSEYLLAMHSRHTNVALTKKYVPPQWQKRRGKEREKKREG